MKKAMKEAMHECRILVMHCENFAIHAKIFAMHVFSLRKFEF